jgi:glycosyltransferase involved in cell wall biosynthesis
MHVLVNAVSAKRGGILTYTANLCRELNNRGLTATINVPPGFPGAGIGPGSGARLVSSPAANFGALRRLMWEQTAWRDEIRASGADVVFSSANYAVLSSPLPQLLLLREGGLFNPLYRRHVLPRMGPRYRAEAEVRRSLMISSARHSTVVMFPSETMRDWVLSTAPDLKDRAVVNHYGTYVEMFRRPRLRQWRADGGLRLLYVSVYYPHKNPLTLAQATRILGEQGIPAHARITMTRPEFALWPLGRREYQKLSEGGLADLVSLGGIPYPELPGAYAEHDVFVFPSVSETFGHPLVEAMAAGIPIVAADTLTCREICGPAALYHSPYDPEHLAQCIRELDADPELRAWLTEQSLKRVARRFGWNAHVERLLATLQQMAGSS